MQVASAGALPALAFDPSLPLIILADGHAESGDEVLPGRHARRGPRAVLASLYPTDHELLELPGRRARRLADLDDAVLGASSWLVPALDPLDNLASPHGMAAISARLRAPDGCPWDRKQTHLTLRPYLLEEAYETVDAIEHGTPADLAEELGDLLLQVILHAQFAAEEGAFDLTDVYRSIAAKIVRRHPHVFGGLEVDRRRARCSPTGRRSRPTSAPSGARATRVPSAASRARCPALPGSREIQERASALGWDWDAIDGVWEKVGEEVEELRAADERRGCGCTSSATSSSRSSTWRAG